MAMAMAKLRAMALAAVFGGGLLLGARGCGGVTDTRAAARDAATKATCDRYMTCGHIGATNATYPDYASCQIAWQAMWDSNWPAADCAGKINQANLNVCVARITSTSCTNIIDILNTEFVVCGKATVCPGAPANTDGAAD